jgi:hypothetical protein
MKASKTIKYVALPILLLYGSERLMQQINPEHYTQIMQKQIADYKPPEKTNEKIAGFGAEIVGFVAKTAKDIGEIFKKTDNAVQDRTRSYSNTENDSIKYYIESGEFETIRPNKEPLEDILTEETMKKVNPKNDPKKAELIRKYIPLAKTIYDMRKPDDPITFNLYTRLMKGESNFNPKATSYRMNKNGEKVENAKGLMQIVDATWKFVAKKYPSFKIYDPRLNMAAGLVYIEFIHAKFMKYDWYKDADRQTKQQMLIGGYHDGPENLIEQEGNIMRLSEKARQHIDNVTG